MVGLVSHAAALVAIACLLTSAKAQGVLTAFTGVSSYFAGCGSPYCGCGMPADMLTDDNGKPIGFVALNTFYQTTPTAPATTGAYANGLNCGRIIKFTAGNGCTGGAFSGYKVCIKGSTSGTANYDKTPDAIAKEGKVMYAMVVDMCSDTNFFCRLSRWHLNISMKYLISVFGSVTNWNNRFVTWEYVDAPPAEWSMTKLKLAWGINASLKGYYLPLIIANTPNGIKGVAVLMANGQWAVGERNGPLGSQWKLPIGTFKRDATGRIQVRITSYSGSVAAPYGSFWVPLPPGVASVVKITAVRV